MDYLRILGNKPFNLPAEEVVFLESKTNYTLINCKSGKKFLSSRTLKIHENRLQSFIRINRSILLNKSYIIGLRNGSIIYINTGQNFKISRRRIEFFNKKMSESMPVFLDIIP